MTRWRLSSCSVGFRRSTPVQFDPQLFNHAAERLLITGVQSAQGLMRLEDNPGQLVLARTLVGQGLQRRSNGGAGVADGENVVKPMVSRI